MNKNEPVSHIMTQHVYTVQQRDRLQDAISIIRRHHIHHLPVKKGGEIVGMLSSTDIDRLCFDELFDEQEKIDDSMINMLSIQQVMTTHFKSVHENTSIKEVAEIFAKNGFHALPVIDDNDLKGIVTTTDIIKYMLSLYQTECK